MNILYLTLTRFNTAPYRDASTRYRCFHFAEDLRAAGHNADIASIDHVSVQQLSYYDVVCVLRPTVSRQLQKILRACQQLGILTIADFDDLLFSPDHAERAPAVLSHQSSIGPARRKFQRHLRALRSFPCVIVATTPLADYVRQLHPGGSVITLPNGLSRYWMESNQHLNTPVIPESATITYLPGSRSHNADFGQITDVLAEWLNDHPDVTLSIIGELEFDTRRFKSDQVRVSPWMEYSRLPNVTRNSLATIAPLANTEFNRCKSHIKFIESAAFGTPVIASAIPDITRHTAVNGLHLVHSPDDWEIALNKLLEKRNSLSVRHDLKQYVRTHCMNGSSIEQLLSFITLHTTKIKNVNTAAYANAS